MGPFRSGFLDMNYFRIFKITSIFAFVLISYLAPTSNAYAAWSYYTYQEDAAAACLSKNSGWACEHTTYSGNINGDPSKPYSGYYYEHRHWSNDYHYYNLTGATPEPDISDCTLTDAYFNYGTKNPDGTWTTSEIPDYYYNDGCKYSATPRTTDDGGMCYTFPNSDDPNKGWCIVDLTAYDTYVPGETDSPTNSEYPTGDTSLDQEMDASTPEQDTTADNLSDWFGSEPVETFNYPDGSKYYKWQSSTGCILEIIQNTDGSYSEQSDNCNVHYSSGETIPYGTEPQWEPDYNHTNPDGTSNEGGGTGDNTSGSYADSGTPDDSTANFGDTGSSGTTDSQNGNPTPTAPTTDDPAINADDPSDTQCDPAIEDCDSKNTALLSDIKELLNYDDLTSITDAETDFNTGLDNTVTELEGIASDNIDIEGFNISNMVKSVLNLPTAPPASQDFVISSNFVTSAFTGSQQEIRIENIYEKTSLLRTLLSWLFFMTSAFSIYHILFSGRLA